MSDIEQSPIAGDPPKDPKVIKRYSNRKLYDTVESRYVTLEEIAEMVKSGAEVKILDNRTKEDLTAVTLAQIIFAEEKKKSHMPLSMLKDIIRHPGESLSSFIQKEIGPKIASIREEAESIRDRLLKREGDPRGSARDQARELMQSSQRAVEDLQHRVDDRVRSIVEAMTSLPAIAKELQQIDSKLSALEKRVDEIGASKPKA